MPDNSLPRPHHTPPPGPPPADTEVTITPLAPGPHTPARSLFHPRPEHITQRRSALAGGLLVLVLLAIALSASGAWPALATPWNTARQWLRGPTLTVRSPVPWARVWVDGHDAGPVGTRIALGLGSHTITVQATGFVPQTRHLSFADTLRTIPHGLTLQVPAHVLPGTVAQMDAAINRALDATYGTNSVALIARGQIYLPGHVAPVALRARLTVTMVDSGPLFSCPPQDNTCEQSVSGSFAGTTNCRSSATGPYALCVSPYLALLSPLNTDPQKAVTAVRIQLTAQFFDAATGKLVSSSTIADPNYQGSLVQLWPSHHGWQASAVFSSASALIDLQTDIGQAQLTALVPSVVKNAPPLQITPLDPPGEGILFTAFLLSPPEPVSATPTWLLHMGMLYTLGTAAHRLTPTLPAVPSALTPLVQRACAGCLAESGAMIPTGATLYTTAAPGGCEGPKNIWSHSALAIEHCNDNQLILSDPNCSCPLALARLNALPNIPPTFPNNNVAEVTAQSIGPNPRTPFGILLRVPAVHGDSDTFGGYGFLIDRTGRWQFNRYNADGTRDTLAIGQWSEPLTGAVTLDVTMGGPHFSLYLNGMFVTTQYDPTYASGTFALAVGPGGTVAFSDLGIYKLPG